MFRSFFSDDPKVLERKAAEKTRSELLKQYKEYHPLTHLGKKKFAHVNKQLLREIGDMKFIDEQFKLVFLLRGPAGSGKSSLVGTICDVLGEIRTSLAQVHNDQGTLYVERHLADTSCIVLDSRGQTRFNHQDSIEEALIVEGHLRAGQQYKGQDLCTRFKVDSKEPFQLNLKKRFLLKDVPHVVIQVVNGADQNDWSKTQELVPRANYFASRHMKTICIVTKMDRLSSEDERKRVLVAVGKAFGTPPENCFALQTYHTHHVCDPQHRDYHTELTLLRALIRAQLMGELFLHEQLTGMFNREDAPQPVDEPDD